MSLYRKFFLLVNNRELTDQIIDRYDRGGNFRSQKYDPQNLGEQYAKVPHPSLVQ